MRKHAPRIAAISLLVAVAVFGHALAQVSLTPTASHPDELAIGSPLTVFIELTNLPAGAGLDSVFATVGFDGNLLGAPTLSPGGALPSPPGDPPNFVSASMWDLPMGHLSR